MDDRFLHEGEMLLASRRASGAVLVGVILKGLFEALVAGSVISVLITLGSIISGGSSLAYWIYILIFVACAAVTIYQHVYIWREATFRITTERILVANPHAFFHAPLITIKWPQYQECEVGHRAFFDVFFGARPLRFRYGTADARSEAHYPSLRYAEDLKHYIDKVDAAVRKNDVTSLRPFVAAPRGKRDDGMMNN